LLLVASLAVCCNSRPDFAVECYVLAWHRRERHGYANATSLLIRETARQRSLSDR